eukprot:2432336-Prorocentrum_lima.AAC.1
MESRRAFSGGSGAVRSISRPRWPPCTVRRSGSQHLRRSTLRSAATRCSTSFARFTSGSSCRSWSWWPDLS